MNTYFLADPHFFGKNVIRFSKRTWAMSPEEANSQFMGVENYPISAESGAEMNAIIIGQIRSKVTPEDRLIFLGDVVFAGNARQARSRTIEILSRLPTKDVKSYLG